MKDHGTPAGLFAPQRPVYSEMAVRKIVVWALEANKVDDKPDSN